MKDKLRKIMIGCFYLICILFAFFLVKNCIDNRYRKQREELCKKERAQFIKDSLRKREVFFLDSMAYADSIFLQSEEYLNSIEGFVYGKDTIYHHYFCGNYESDISRLRFVTNRDIENEGLELCEDCWEEYIDENGP